MKKTIIILTILLSISLASSIELIQETKDVSLVQEINQPALVDVTIANAIKGAYNIYTLTYFNIEPSESFELEDGNNSILVRVYPTSQLINYGPASNTFEYKMRRHSNDEITLGRITVRVVSIIDALEIISEENNPDDNTIGLRIKNKENINLRNISARFFSSFFDSEQSFDVSANGEVEIRIPVDKAKLSKMEFGSYVVSVDISTDVGIRTIEGRVLIDKKEDIDEKIVNSGIIIRKNKITKINTGNTVEPSVTISVSKNIITRLFTYFNTDPERIDRSNGKITYYWSKKLSPGESMEISVSTNYAFPILALALIIILIILFRKYTQMKLVIEKTATPVKTKGEGYALRIKINLTAKKSIKNLSVIDRIPRAVKIHDKFSGSIKPNKVDTKNKRIQWDLGDLSAGNKRSFEYIVYSHIGIIGKLTLPSALAVFEKDEKVYEVKSENVFFMAEQTAK